MKTRSSFFIAFSALIVMTWAAALLLLNTAPKPSSQEPLPTLAFINNTNITQNNTVAAIPTDLPSDAYASTATENTAAGSERTDQQVASDIPQDTDSPIVVNAAQATVIERLGHVVLPVTNTGAPRAVLMETRDGTSERPVLETTDPAETTAQDTEVNEQQMVSVAMQPRACTPVSFTIVDGDTAGLIAAINAANDETCHPGEDTITLATNGTYTFTEINNNTYGNNALPAISSEIIINGNGSVIERDLAAPHFRFFYVYIEGGTFTLNQVTLQNGHIDTYSGSYDYITGGAIRGSGIILNDVIVRDSKATGTDSQGRPATGGGVSILYLDPPSRFENVTIDNNEAEGSGGGLYTRVADLSIFNSTISNNTAAKGGGIHHEIGTVNITQSAITGNTATNHAAITTGGDIDGATLNIRQSLIANNTATQDVGGIFNETVGNLTITDSTISGNSAGGEYGAIFNKGWATIEQSTIANNTATTYGALYTTADLNLWQSILAYNSGNDCGVEGFGKISTGGYNMIDDADCTLTQNISPIRPDFHNTDPLLGPLADNGGPTMTHALQASSPAIDVVPSYYFGRYFDQRGLYRPQGPANDIGAFEVQDGPCPVVDFTIADGDTSGMIAAIAAANNELCYPGVDTITLATNGTYTFTTFDNSSDANGKNALPEILSSIVINGNGSTLERVSSEYFRFFSIRYTKELELNDITLRGGHVHYPLSTLSGGGAIANLGGTLTINNSTLTENQATSPDAHNGSGGAIGSAGLAILNNVTLSNNVASNVGGAFTSWEFSTIQIKDSLITGNSAKTGGAFNFVVAEVTIEDSVISGNTAEYAAGIYIADTPYFAVVETLDIVRTSIINNTATVDASAIWSAKFDNEFSSPSDDQIVQLINSTISGNTGPVDSNAIVAAGTINIDQSTIANNTGGLSFDGIASTISRSSFDSASGSNCTIGSGTFTSGGYNISSDTSCGFASTGDLNNTDPLLAPLADNGGPTQTHALLASSPAVDAIPVGSCTVSTDQRGVSRPQGDNCDIGAVEMEPETCPTVSFTIANGDTAGLIAAINAANDETCHPGEDTITLATNGTYTFTEINNNTYGNNALPAITSEIIINGNGSIIERDLAAPHFRFFYVEQGPLTLNQMSLQNGHINNYTENYDYITGGAIRGSGIILNDVIVRDSKATGTDGQGRAARGGGIAIDGSEPHSHLNNVTIEDNDADGSGGGIHVIGDEDYEYFLIIENSTIQGNHAAKGGGLYYEKGTINIVDTAIVSNTATDHGGITSGNGTDTASLTIDRSLIANNSATQNVGGIYVENNVHLTINDSTISGNSAGGEYGAVYNNGNTTIERSTIANNTATTYGALYNFSGWLEIRQSILAYNSGSDCGFEGTAKIATYGFNILGDDDCTLNDTSAIAPDFHNTDPLLGPLADNGGPTMTHALQAGSPAIDVVPSYYFDQYFDQRGLYRPQGPANDIGAFEVQDGPCPVVDFTIADGDTSGMIAAIAAANNELCYPGVDTITLATNGTYTFTTFDNSNDAYGKNALPEILSSIIINGNGSTLERVSSEYFRFFSIRYVSGDLTLNTITLRGGHTNFGDEITNDGGAILNTGILTINNSTLTENQATLGSGGAILNAGDAILDNVVLSNNTASYRGGAIKSWGVVVQIKDSIFTGNSAETGGALDFDHALVTIEDSLISNNTADYAGAIHIQDTFNIAVIETLDIVRTSIVNNTATVDASAIWSTIYDDGLFSTTGDQIVTLTNSTVSGNTGPVNSNAILAAGTINIDQSTITNNTGGLSFDGIASTISRSIFDSASGSNCTIGSGTFTSGGYNISSDASCGFAETGDLNNTYPQLTPLSDNGGPTQTHALLSTSPALDAIPAGSCTLSTDQRGVSRPQNTNCDIGAVEMEPATCPTVSFTIADGDTTGLIAAINAANDETCHPGADTITLANNGTYTFTTYDNSGEYGAQALPYISTAIVINGNGATLTRSGSEYFRFFFIDFDASLTLNDITLDNGHTHEELPAGNGSYTVNAGGAILNAGTLTVNDSNFTNNQTTGFDMFGETGTGGAIRNVGTTLIVNSTFSANASAFGAVISNDGDITIQNSTITNNSATQSGGAFYQTMGVLTVEDSILSGNNAPIGGVSIAYAASTTNITRSLVTNNTGNFILVLAGGPSNLSEIVLNITNSTLSGNGGSEYVIHSNGQTNIRYSTIAHNALGALDLYTTHNTIEGSILSDNTGDNCRFSEYDIDEYGTLTSDGYNISDDATCGLASTGDSNSTNPMLAALADNGGPTQTHALLASSPAIDAVPDNVCNQLTDQRGLYRPQGTSCDIGAFEAQDGPCPIADFTISDGDIAGLIAAIEAANNDLCYPGTDTITLATNGTYTFTAYDNLSDYFGGNALPAILSHIIIEGNNSTFSRDAAPTNPFRFFDIRPIGTLELNALTLENGYAHGEGYDIIGHGGAILSNGTLTINDSTLTNNAADAADLDAMGGEGGAIYSSGYVTLNNVTLSGNIATFGGAFHHGTGIATIRNSLFTGNVANYGAAISTENTWLTIEDSTIRDNMGDYAPAIYTYSFNENEYVTVIRSLIAYNDAFESNGVIWSRNSNLNSEYPVVEFINSTISGNFGPENSKAIYANGSLKFHNSTVADNPGGVYFEGPVNLFTNSIFTNNGGANCATGGSVTLNSDGYNISDDGTCGFNSTGDLNSTDPQITPLSNNGGPTQTHALLSTSPALDAIPAGSCTLSTDQRGVSRPQNTNCDIGAVEMEPATCPTVSFTIADGDTTGLIAAINAANDETCHPDTDTITLATNGTYTFTTHDNAGDYGGQALPWIETDIIINGNGATLTRSSSDYFRFFFINFGASLTLNDITLDNGHVHALEDTSETKTAGGAILNGGTLTIANSSFTNNQATGYVEFMGDVGEGGAIRTVGTVLITNTSFSGNSSNYGGTFSNAGEITIQNSSFTNNSATGGSGVFLETYEGTITIEDSIISNNSAPIGSVMANFSGGGTVNITRSLIANNTGMITLALAGSGINTSSPVLNITNSTLSGNTGDGYVIHATGQVNIAYSTIAHNGIGALDLNSTYSTIVGSILSDNTGDNCYFSEYDIDEYGTLTSNGYNISDDATCGFASTGDSNSTNPMLATLADNGGPTQTHALQAGSPAIDAIPGGVCGVSTDQRGVSRPQNTNCDIGAFETEAVVITPPAAPSNLQVTNTTETSIAISWTDNANNETGFKIEQSTNGTNWSQIGTTDANVTAYIASSLTCNTTYYYRVRASHNDGDSAYSNTVNQTTSTCPPPAAPSNLQVTNTTETSITLSWTDNANNETGYEVDRSADGVNWSNIADLPANSTSYENTGLTCGSTFYYRVRAYRTSDSSYSDYATIGPITVDCMQPGPTYTVNTTADVADGVCGVLHCSLREAVIQSNNTAGANTINLPAGAYQFALEGQDEDYGVTGDLDIRDDLTIIGAGAETTIIDAKQLDRVFDVVDLGAETNVTIEYVTITNGKNFSGSAMKIFGKVTLNYVTVTDNDDLAFVDRSSAELVINHSTITNNESIRINGTLKLSDSYWETSRLEAYTRLEISDSTIVGARVVGSDNYTLISNSTLKKVYQIRLRGYADIRDSRITQLDFYVLAAYGQFFISNTSFYDISNTYSWLVEVALDGVLHLDHVTFADVDIGRSHTTQPRSLLRTTTTGSGIISNSIITVDNAPPCLGTGFTFERNNIVSTAGCGPITTRHNFYTDPQLEPLYDLENNLIGYQPAADSPAVDLIPAGECTQSVDQRGLSRPQGSGCDAGAIERFQVNAPTQVQARLEDTIYVEVSWTDNSSNEDEFRIERSEDGINWTEIGTVGANVTSFVDNSVLACYTPYSYRVRAVAAQGSSLYSNIAEITTKCTPPVTPSNLQITATERNSIALFWTDNATDEWAYYVEHSTNGVDWAALGSPLAADSTTFTHEGLICGTDHYYRVNAFREFDIVHSEPSNVVNDTTDACPTLNKPTTPAQGTTTRTSADVEWNNNFSNEASAVFVERSLDGTNWASIAELPPTADSFSDTILICGTSYQYRIRAYREEDNSYSPYSDVLILSTDACPVAVTNTMGLYKDGVWMFRDSNDSGVLDVHFLFGPQQPGWTPLIGDWDGDGVDGIGLYKDGKWIFRNSSDNGPLDIVMNFAMPGEGWLPIVGDWNGDNIDTPALYKAGTVAIKNNTLSGSADARYIYGPQETGWLPIAGDWNGSGTDTLAYYKAGQWIIYNGFTNGSYAIRFNYGPAEAGWIPLAGDWDQNLSDTIGLYKGGNWRLRNTNNSGTVDLGFTFGTQAPGWQPVASYRGAASGLSVMGMAPINPLAEPVTDPTVEPTLETSTPVPTVTDQPEITPEPTLPTETSEPTATDLPEMTPEPTLEPTQEVSPTAEPTLEPTEPPPTETPMPEVTAEPAGG